MWPVVRVFLKIQWQRDVGDNVRWISRSDETKRPCGEKEGWRFKQKNKIKNIFQQIWPKVCKFVEKYIFFVLFFILHRPAVRISLPFHDIHYSPARFCDKSISCNVNMHSFLFYHIGSFYWPLSTHCLSRYEALGRFRVYSNEVAKRSHTSWNSTR